MIFSKFVEKFVNMDTQPLISVITITYNAESTLLPTLESVASQKYKNIEHILIDGASTDNTLSIARNYPDLRILSEKDNGLYDAMNKGLRLARGKYVLFLNAGDSFHSNKVLDAYASRAERGDHIIFGDTVIVDKDRHIVGKRHLTAPISLTKESFSKGMLICHQAFMVKKELAPEFDLRYQFSADYDWTIRCIDNSDPRKCTNLSMITIDYLKDGLTDKNKIKSLRERYSIMNRHFGAAKTFINHIGFIFRALGRKIKG